VVGGEWLAVDLDASGAGEVGMTGDSGDAASFHVTIPVSVDVSDVAVAAGDQLRPVGLAAPRGYPEGAGVVNGVGQIRRVPHHFLGHAASVHAGAAHLGRFHHGHVPAKLGGPLGDCEAAAASADSDQIEVLLQGLFL
jgi:hypothetical protein